MAVKGINGADLNNISRVDGRSNVLDKVNGVDADLSPPAVAYSVRNVSGLTGIPYDGPAMRILVDATGDGADATDLEFDINFTADGDLDVADIELKCAGGKDAYVVKWYDQSGAGNDAVQTAYADMPKIATAGAVITENGKPAPLFDLKFMDFSDTTLSNTTALFVVMDYNSVSLRYLHDTGSSGLRIRMYQDNNWQFVQNGIGTFVFAPGKTTGEQLLFTMYGTGTDYYYRTDATQRTTQASTTGMYLESIGADQSWNKIDANIQEFIAYSADQSSNITGIENNINSYFNIYQSRENILPGAAAAYSLRQLSDSSRLAIRVRRDTGVGSGTDDDEADVGFDANGELSLASPVSNFDPTGSAATTLGGFLGHGGIYGDSDNLGAPADGFVTAWYDQSANANNATQTAPASQPKIYDSSTGLITENGKAAVSFNGSTNVLQFDLTTGVQSGGYWHSFHVMQSTDATAVVMSNRSNASGWYMLSENDTEITVHAGMTHPTRVDSSSTNYWKNGTQQLSGLTRADLTNTFFDGNQVLFNFIATTTNGLDFTDWKIGEYYTSGFEFDGVLQEIVIYQSDESSNRTDIESNINAHYGIANFGTPSSGLLADYPGSAAAYSVRKLADTAGLAMRIIVDDTAVIGTVDASDTEYDIGFDANGDLDVARIREVCNNPSGTNYNAYVVTWYDQSGNGNHATQTTYTACPQIYDGVDVIMENGKPAIQWNATNQTFLETAATDTWSDGSTYTSMVFDGRQGPSGSHTYWDIETGVQRYSSGTAEMLAIFYGSGDVPRTSTAFSGQGLHTWYSVASETNAAVYIDGNLEGSTARTGNVGDQNVTACIGSRSGTEQWNSCKYQEIVHWGSDVASNRSVIEENINSYYRVYGDPDDGLLSTPYGKGAAAAYSVRQLSNNATRAMRILVDADANGPDASDNEYDIGFDANGELDIAKIEELCDKGTGNYDAYVTTWYDQSGEGNDATQATHASMPKICNAGTVILENGKPALDFDGTNDGLNCSTNLRTSTGASTVTQVRNVPQPTLLGGIHNYFAFYKVQRQLSGKIGTPAYENIAISTNETANELIKFVNSDLSGQLLHFATWDGSTQASGVDEVVLYEDGTQETGTVSTITTGVTPSGTNCIGFRNDLNSQYCDGTFQEVIVWLSDQDSAGNRTLIEANINDYFNIEGV